jgi:hypothetical protein
MKSIAKLLLVGAVAVTAIAISAAPSEAAKKKKMRHRAAASHSMTCKEAGLCSANCAGATCAVNVCGADGKWYPAVLTPFCLQGQCPPKC